MKLTTKDLYLGLVMVVYLVCMRASACADTIYVSDFGSNTVIKFDSTGQSTVFASGLNLPTAMAFDGSGYLYVANAGDNTILKFDPCGNGSVFASSGLSSPFGLAFDIQGNLYVLNSEA